MIREDFLANGSNLIHEEIVASNVYASKNFFNTSPDYNKFGFVFKVNADYYYPYDICSDIDKNDNKRKVGIGISEEAYNLTNPCNKWDEAWINTTREDFVPLFCFSTDKNYKKSYWKHLEQKRIIC